MNDNRTCTMLIVAGALATALSSIDSASAKIEQEKCYGVSLKGKNDCAAGPGSSCAGSATKNYQRDAWKYVPKGTCTSIVTPKGKGSLDPIAN